MKKMIALSALVLMLAAGTVTVMTVQPQAAVAGPCSQCVTESCPTAGGCVTESCPSANGCVAAEPATPARVACTSPNCVNEDCPNGNGGCKTAEPATPARLAEADCPTPGC